VYIGAGARGERYEGEWVDGRRHGRGVASYGNNDGTGYVCPLGNLHDGAARCFYDGAWARGLRDGVGTFTCCDGRQYSGGWRRDKRHGTGRSVMLPAALHHQLGAPAGGGGGAPWPGAPKVRFGDQARMRVYEGEFVKNRREGRGKATMNSGDVLECLFRGGHADGPVKVTFASGKVRYAVFALGMRQRWMEAEEVQALVELVSAAGQGRPRSAGSRSGASAHAMHPQAGAAASSGSRKSAAGGAPRAGGQTGSTGRGQSQRLSAAPVIMGHGAWSH
jgi:hypothetical protein